MENFKLPCDCLFTNHEDPLCAAMYAMDKSLLESSQKNVDSYSYLIVKYGPSAID